MSGTPCPDFLSIMFFTTLLIVLSITSSHCVDEWQQMITSFAAYESKRIESDISFAEYVLKSTDVSFECRHSVNRTLEALKSSQLFAYQMYDSWPTFPPQSILDGTVNAFGDYDQCMAIEANQVIGSSQYCLIRLRIPLPKSKTLHINLNHKVEEVVRMFDNKTSDFFSKLADNAVFFRLFPVRLGLCLPDKCHQKDVQLLAETAFGDSGLVLEKVDCNTRPEKDWHNMQIIALAIFALFIGFTIYATILGNKLSDPNSNQLVKCFSLKLNSIKLLSTDAKPELSAIDGLRVLTMAYIIAVHTIELTDWDLYDRTFKIKDTMNGWENIPLTKVNTVVSTFFLISGVLSCYNTLKLTRNNKNRFDIVFYLIQRVIRMWPLMAIFILGTTLIPRLNSGPYWNQFFERRVGNCYTNWWTNLFFFNNFVNQDKMCIITTWYIPVDIQIHVLSVLVIWTLLRRTGVGFVVNALMIISSSLVVSAIIAVKDFTPGRVSTQFGPYWMGEFMKHIYWKPWTHAPVYFIGTYLGYYLYNMRPVKISKFTRRIVWCLIIMCFMVCIYDTHFWTSGVVPNNRFVSAVLYPFTRLLWSLAVGAVLWLCASGNGSLVNRFLSCSAFTVLSRLTYSVYLSHVWVVWLYWASVRHAVPLYPSSMFALICYTLLASYGLGFGFALLFECPINYFQTYLKNAIKSKSIL